MNDEELFESYLEYRIQRDGALTPGQKLSVVRQLQEEARQGRVPSGPNSVVNVPLESPVVQAILRGEPISVGNTSMRRKSRVESLSVGQRLGILGGLALLVIVVPLALFLLLGSRKDAPEQTPTAAPSQTVAPTDTPTPLPTNTIIPTETVTGTPAPAFFGGPTA